MKSFFKSAKFRICVGVLAVLFLGVFLAGISDSGTTPLSKGLSVVLKPLNSIALQVKETFSHTLASFRSSSYYMDEIESLKEEIESMKEDLVDHEKIRHKLSAYEAFLEIKSDHEDYSFVPASVLSRGSSDAMTTFTIDRGSSNGLHLDDPVIYGKNLLGVVRELTPASATVYTVFHPSVSVAAYEIRTREDCYTEAGTEAVSAGQIRICGLTRSTPVVTGGIVCTSGIGGVYPRDLILGKVSRVVNSESDISAYALVAPDVDFGAVTDVFVITDFNGKYSPAE